MAFVYLNQTPTNIRLVKPQPADTTDHLPARVYTLGADSNGIFLETLREKFDLPEKIYGAVGRHCAMLVDAYKKTKTSIGAVFVGQKGAGKSLLAEAVANRVLQMDVPVIYVASGLPPSMLTDVVRNIGPCAVIFEEFGKYYPSESSERFSQADLLPLFSDSSLSKVIFMITENNSSDINCYYKNRPGRIEFWIEMESATGKDFAELAEGYPIHPEVLKYIEHYVHRNPIGNDTLLALRDLAVNVPTVAEFADKLIYRNMPRPHKAVMQFKRIWNKVTGEPLMATIVDKAAAKDHVTLKVFTMDLAIAETITIHRSDLDPMADINDPVENKEPTVLYRYESEKNVYIVELASTILYTKAYSEADHWVLAGTTYLNGHFVANKLEAQIDEKAGRPVQEPADSPLTYQVTRMDPAMARRSFQSSPNNPNIVRGQLPPDTFRPEADADLYPNPAPNLSIRALSKKHLPPV